MRTSASQFELMVSYMERHGVLSRPCHGPQGRISNIQNWTELVNLLNADAMGETKTEEKWRKTWSDLKNNTKRKAAKINRAVGGTGGGRASRTKLTDLEERVIAIMHPQSATGMPEIIEIGLQDDQQVTSCPPSQVEQSAHGGDNTLEISSRSQPASQSQFESWNIATGSRSQPVFEPPSETWNVAANSSQPTPGQGGQRTSPPATPPATTRASPQRRRRDRRRNILGLSPRRTRPGTSQSELARQTFVNSDREWREFLISKEQRAHDLEKERLRLREIELRQQAKWQELFAQFLLVLEKISDSINKK